MRHEWMDANRRFVAERGEVRELQVAGDPSACEDSALYLGNATIVREILRLAWRDERQRSLIEDIAIALKCLPSTFPDANGHVLEAARSLAERAKELESLLLGVQSWMEWSIPGDESNAQMRLRREMERILGSPEPGAEVLDITEAKAAAAERERIRQLALAGTEWLEEADLIPPRPSSREGDLWRRAQVVARRELAGELGE